MLTQHAVAPSCAFNHPSDRPLYWLSGHKAFASPEGKDPVTASFHFSAGCLGLGRRPVPGELQPVGSGRCKVASSPRCPLCSVLQQCSPRVLPVLPCPQYS
eukprot:120543-Pleurochrysis_carterae.AAC.1